jgi:SAM-dependent methyltransferase
MRYSPFLRRLAWRTFHESLGRRFGGLDRWTFMNYGYADLREDARAIPLEPDDEDERYCAQLYAHVTEGIDLVDRDILEVGCGRGGGVSYMARALSPHRVAGLDVAAHQVAFCRRVHRDPKVVFHQGDAEHLPFDDGSFDAIVNVESSFAYGRMDVFLAEVERVLKPGGYFLFADVRLATKVDELTDQLAGAGLTVAHTENISTNVLRALELDADRRRKAAVTLGSAYGLGVMPDFIGVEGTRIPTLLSSGELIYLSARMLKPDDDLGAGTSSEKTTRLAAKRDLVTAA